MAYSAEAGEGEAIRVGLDAVHPVHPSGTSATQTCLFLDLVPFSFSFRRSHGL